MGKLENKVAMITGAASGIGEAAAHVFASEGAKVLIVDVQEDKGNAVAAAVKAAGGTAEFCRCDVSRAVDVDTAVAKAVGLFGGLDILYSNAAIQFDKPLLETSEEDWDRLMAVNVKGAFLCSKAAIPRMQNRGGGSIVFTASVNGMVSEPRLAAYCTSKGGLIMLAKSICIDYGHDNIRANALCPGWVDTPINEPYLSSPENRAFGNSMQPRGRIGTPEEIAKVAAFLASDEASFMTGAAVVVDGGLTSVLNGHKFIY